MLRLHPRRYGAYACFVGGALLLAVASGCRSRPYDLVGVSNLDDGATGDDLAAAHDFAVPSDLVRLPDFTPPPDLRLPFVCRDIYVVDSVTRELSGFDTQTHAFTRVGPGPLRCPGAIGNPQTMSVARDDTAWVFYTDFGGGNRQLFLVDLHTGECRGTAFDGKQLVNDDEFGSAFSADVPGGNLDTLFMALPGDQRVSALDGQTLRLRAVGPLTMGQAELTGTSAAELFAFFPGPPATIFRVDKRSGALDARIDVPLPVGMSNGFAFAFWGGSFWIFLSSQDIGAGNTGVFRVDARTHEFSTVVPDTGRHIVGAGVAACAPLGLDP